MASTITWDILRQVFAEFTDEQLATLRVGLAESDAERERMRNCCHCDNGIVQLPGRDTDLFRRFVPCPYCRTPNPPTSGEG